MQTLGTAFDRELRKRLLVRIDELAHTVASGHLPSYDEYKYQAGVIAGLKAAIEFCDEVQDDLANR